MHDKFPFKYLFIHHWRFSFHFLILFFIFSSLFWSITYSFIWGLLLCLHKTPLFSPLHSIPTISPPLTHTLVSKPLHGRYLNYNAITSIPSGAFTGLTALQYLWGRGAVISLCGSIVLSTTLESFHSLNDCVLDLCSLAMVYYCDSLLINLMMSLFLSWRSQISLICSSFLDKM